MSKQDQHVYVKVVGIGCLILLVIGIAGGYFIYKNARRATLNLVAKGVESSAEVLLKELPLSAEEHQTVMAPIHKFTQDIRDGNVSFEQGTQVVAATLMDTSIISVIVSHNFEGAYVKNSFLTGVEKQAAHITITRFTHGMIEEKIPFSDDDVTSIFEGISYEIADEDGKKHRRFKESLTPEELEQALSRMKTVADRADIEDKAFTIDLATVIQSAIEKGMRGEL